MADFHNPYHFVPVERTSHDEHSLSVEDFEQRDLGHYSHAAYHNGMYNGRIICRLTTTDNLMFVGAKSERENNEQPATAKHFELETNKPAIPASTLRGLLSSIAETASNSALRVLNDQVLSYRQEMRKSLSAIGMVQVEKNQVGETVYKLLPLSMPTLKEAPYGGKQQGKTGFTFFSNLDDPNERTKERDAYKKMFPEPRLKIYVGEYDHNNELKPPSLRDKDSFSVGSNAVILGIFKQTFERDSYLIREHESLHVKTIPTRTGDARYVIGQKRYKPSPSPVIEKTRGIFRILGKKGRDDIPKTKKHELLIPYPKEAENWETFPILPEAIERFEQLADECTKPMEEKAEKEKIVFEDMTPQQKEEWRLSLLPYHLKGTERNNDRNQCGDKLRLKQGDLVYFRPTMQDNQAVVSEVSFSSIWRGRVEDQQGHKASVHRFFSDIDPELLPFNKARKNISPAELLFGFVEHRDEEQKKEQQEAGRTFAGRVHVSFGQLAPHQSAPYYDKQVTLKILATPKLPCPTMYFKNRYTKEPYIKKADIKLGKHQPKQGQPEHHHQPQGRKMYIHHRYNPRRDTPPWKTTNAHERANQKTRIEPVKQGTEFFFHIDFNNLSEWELGLLCYALRPTEEFHHKIGMGKSIGLGKVCINPVGLFLINREQRYGNDDIFTSQRYHQAWIKEDIELPEAFYPQEIGANNLEPPPLTWQELRDRFRNQMSPKIQKALELLGDPAKVTHPVHTPLVKQQLQNPEEETFRWFVENDKHGQHQMLKPLDQKSTELPTLKMKISNES
jgi:CRISPR-associated protein (TIGR03986 family)